MIGGLKIKYFFWSIAIIAFVSTAGAQEKKFPTTKDGMIQVLEEKMEKKKSRETQTRTWSLNDDEEDIVEAPRTATRAIMVIQNLDNKEEEKEIRVSENDEDVVKLMTKIEFDVNSSKIKPSCRGLLNEVYLTLIDDRIKDKTIIINGHTDTDGSEAYNLRLSYERAWSVKQYLSQVYGLTGRRLQVRGYGEMMPVMPNDSPENKQINRRVEFEIID